MKPRAFRVILALVIGILAMPMPTAAQPLAKVHRIGFLSTTTTADMWRTGLAYHAFLEPVEQPARFEMAVNLKVAKALGITIPKSILQRPKR